MTHRTTVGILTLAAGLACTITVSAQQRATSRRTSRDEASNPATHLPTSQSQARTNVTQAHQPSHAVQGALRTPAQFAQHRRWVDDQRALFRQGNRDWKAATSLDLIDDLIPPTRRSVASSSVNSRANNVNHPWGALIDSNDYVLDFEDPVYVPTTLNPTTENPFISLQGVDDPNGGVWFVSNNAAFYTGIANNASAQTGPRWDPDGADNDPLTEGPLQGDPDQHGEVGGPDPLNEHGKFIVAAAGSMAVQAFSFGNRSEGWLTAKFFAPNSTTPVVTIVDIYADRVDSRIWYAPLSETEGNFFVVSSYWFGHAAGTFASLAVLADPDGVFRRPLVLGPKFGAARGDFFVHPATSPWRAKTDEWFSVGIRQATDSFSVWVYDSQTVGVNGFAQNSIYDSINGLADPSNTQGAFAGELFENDWLQLIPGVDDDPGTPIIEGYGTAANSFFQSYTLKQDNSGSPAGNLFNSLGIDALFFRGGFDPTLAEIPNFTSNDHYLDNFVILGDSFPLAYPQPDFAIPFTDDIELWIPGGVQLQGDDWFVALLQVPSIVTFENNTVGGTQSVEQTASFNNNVYRSSFGRRGLPTVTATATTPAVAQVSSMLLGAFLSRGFVPQDTSEHDLPMANIVLGGRDPSFLINSQIYVRQPNPFFDSTISETEQTGENVIDNGIANVPLVNVPLIDSVALTPITVPNGIWFDLRVEVLLDTTGNAQHPMSVFFDFGSGMIQGVPDGSVRGITTLTSPTPSVNQFEFWTGAETGGLGAAIYVDDLLLDGPRTDDRYNVETEDPTSSYADDPAFTLPYADDLSAYAPWLPIDNRGVTPFLNTVFTDIEGELDIIDVAVAPIAGVTPVFMYTIDGPEILGTLPGGPYVGGEVVAVVDNLPAHYDPLTPAAIPGAIGSHVNYRDALRVRQGAGDWTIIGSSSAPWDGITPIIGRYQFQFDGRWFAPDGQNLVVDDPTASGRGNMVSLVTRADADAVTGDLDPGLSLQLPEANALGGEFALQEFDIFLQDDNPADGPRGRAAWSLQGIGTSRETIAQIVFGGPNNFEDNLTFNPSTGAITPGPDGLPDNFQSNDFQSNPTHVYLLVENPVAGVGLSPFTLVDTGDVMPLNTWVRCSATISSTGSWQVTLDDGVSPLVYSGVSLTTVTGSASNVSGTDYLNIELGNDKGSDGSTQLPAIQWYSLGENAPPEGGLVPLPNDAGTGAFNDSLKYFYYEINQILAPGLNLPMIVDINADDGTVIGPRAITTDDKLAFWNDQSTAGMGGPAGTPIDANQTPRNTRWELVDPLSPATVLARGFWTPLGLPGITGINNPAPRNGITALAPPYNNAIPFVDLLMSTMTNLPQPADFAAPAFVVYIDNISLALGGCLSDFTGDGLTDGADLGLLLGNWGQPGITDLNGDGTTDGADLGILLGVWGPCP